MCIFSECLAAAFEFHAVRVRPLLFVLTPVNSKLTNLYFH